MFDDVVTWVVVGLVFAMIELITPGLFYSLSVSGGACVAAISAYCECDAVTQYIIFVAGIVLSFLFLVFIVRSTVHRSVVSTNIDALPGKIGLVTVMCNELHVGQVLVGGQEWTALALHGQLESGIPIRVVRVQGVRLVVEASTL